MLGGLRTLALDAADLPAVREWYARVLGKAPYFDAPFYAGFDVAGYEIGVMNAAARPGGPRPPVALFAVDDVAATLDRLVGLGATVVDAPRDVGDDIIVAAFEDPFGHLIGLIRNLHFAPPLTAVAADDLSDRALVKDTYVPQPPEAAWGLWASSEGLAAWWVPKSRVDLRPGGFYELYFLDDQPPGLRGGEGCRVLSFVPGRMLSFTWNAPPQLDRTRGLPTWVVLQFDQEGGGTRVTLTHLGWPDAGWDDEPQWAETLAYFDRAWGAVLERFSAHCASAAGA